MYEIGNFKPNGKEMAVCILVAVAVLVAAFGAGYYIGIRNTTKTDGNGGDDGAGQVGQHIQSAITGQREITERIDGLQGGTAQIAGSIEKGAAGIENAAVANSRAESLVRESGELIAEGQRIIQAIRSRNKTAAGEN